MNSQLNLSSLVSPAPLDHFIDNVSGKHPLCIQRQNPDYFSDILTLDQFLVYISRNDFHFPDITISKDSLSVPFEKYTYSSNIGGHSSTMINMSEVLGYFNSGHTVFFAGFERSIDGCRRLASNLITELNCLLSLGGFYTPANSQGFKPHFDSVDVFVLQMFGTKRWRVYNSVFEDSTHTADCDVSNSEIVCDVVLSPGDTLYVPRGHVHEVSTLGLDSFHISVSVSPFNWFDALNLLLPNLKRSPAFRKTFTVGDFSNDSIITELKLLFESHLTSLDPNSLAFDFSNLIKPRLDLLDLKYSVSFLNQN